MTLPENITPKKVHKIRFKMRSPYFTLTIIAISALIFTPSCSDEFLEQYPLSTLSPENTFVDATGLQTVLDAAIKGVFTQWNGDGHVPNSLQPCHLVAAGGIAGVVTQAHDKMDFPTVIEPLGLLADEHGVVNLAQFAPCTTPDQLETVSGPFTTGQRRPEVIAVLGKAMNSGKSTTMACLINGLAQSGRRVSAGKITGTGAGNDPMIYHDAGAHRVLDFTDFGYPTTFQLDMPQLRALTVGLVDELADAATDVVVVEIADGIYQEETAHLLRDELFQGIVDQVVFAASDALGARAGVQELQAVGLRVAVASGVMTASPLATAEASMVLGEVPVIPTYDLTHPDQAAALLVRS